MRNYSAHPRDRDQERGRATFEELPALKLLAVSKIRFGDAGAAQLKELKELKKLEAVNTSLSVKGAMDLEAAVPGVRVKR